MYDAVLDWGLKPGPPALEASTIPLGYRGGGYSVSQWLHAYNSNCNNSTSKFALNSRVKCKGVLLVQLWNIEAEVFRTLSHSLCISSEEIDCCMFYCCCCCCVLIMITEKEKRNLFIFKSHLALCSKVTVLKKSSQEQHSPDSIL